MATNDDHSPTTTGELNYGLSGFRATEAISYSWKKFGENAGPMLLLSFLLFLVVIPGNFAAKDLADTVFGDAGIIVGGVVPTIFTSAVGFVIITVIARGALDITEGYVFDIVLALKMLNLVSVIATSLVLAVLTAFGFALLIIPGIIITFLTLFAIYFVADKDTNAIDSIRDCFELIGDNTADMTVLILLSIAVIIVGFLALCFGALVALPVLAIVWAYSYKVFRGKLVAP